MIRVVAVCSKCGTWTLTQTQKLRAEVFFYCPICRERVPARSVRRSNIPADQEKEIRL